MVVPPPPVQTPTIIKFIRPTSKDEYGEKSKGRAA